MPDLLAGQTAEERSNASSQALESDEGIQKLGAKAEFLDDMHKYCMGQTDAELKSRAELHYKFIGGLFKSGFEKQGGPKLPPSVTEEMIIQPENYRGSSNDPIYDELYYAASLDRFGTGTKRAPDLTNCKTFAEANLKYLNFGIAAQWCWLNWDTHIAIKSDSFGNSYGPLDPKLFEEMREGCGLNDLLTEDTATEARDFISRTTTVDRKLFFDNFGPRAPKFSEFPDVGEPEPADVIAELIKPKSTQSQELSNGQSQAAGILKFDQEHELAFGDGAVS